MARLNYVKSFRGTSKTRDGNLTCGSCGEKIKPGDSYRWWANKLPGARGSYRNIRCAKASCTPRPSQMKPGRTGQIMAIGEGLDDQLRDMSGFTEVSEFESIRNDLASEVRSFGEEIEESAQNMEDGFGHETYQSQELRERAERIEEAASTLESAEIPEPTEHECAECDGDGEVEETHDAEMIQCESCGGTGHDLDSWRDACAEALQDAWGEAEGEMY